MSQSWAACGECEGHARSFSFADEHLFHCSGADDAKCLVALTPGHLLHEPNQTIFVSLYLLKCNQHRAPVLDLVESSSLSVDDSLGIALALQHACGPDLSSVDETRGFVHGHPHPQLRKSDEHAVQLPLTRECSIHTEYAADGVLA